MGDESGGGDPTAVTAPPDGEAMGQVAQDEAQEAEAAGWLALSEAAFRFWDNQDDAVWDRIEPQ